MRDGKFFQIPENEEDLRELWCLGDTLDEETSPEWIEPSERSNYRGLGFSSWASVSAEDQEAYFDELAQMEDAGLIADGDEGDGCVHHFYIARP